MPSPLHVAISPRQSANNEFVEQFADSLADSGARVSGFVGPIRRSQRFDVAIYHWPNRFLRPRDTRRVLSELARMWFAKLRGMKVVWVAHNKGVHDGTANSRLLPALFIRSLDGVIHLSKASRQIINEAYPGTRRVPDLVIVHGRYRDATPPRGFVAPTAQERVIIANVGLVRGYKNLEVLLDTAKRLDAGEIGLLLAGKRFDPGLAEQLEASAGGAEHLKTDFRDDALPQAEMEAMIDAAHGVALPYSDILNSGSALQTLARNRPILAPAIGSMPELAEMVGSTWVQLYDGAFTPEVLRRFLAHVRTIPDGATVDLSQFEWDHIGRRINAFLQSL